MEIERVHVHQVERPVVQRPQDGPPVNLLRLPADIVIERAGLARRRDQPPLHLRTLRCNHHRLMAVARQRAVEQSEDLLAPAHRVRTGRSQRIRHAKNR